MHSYDSRFINEVPGNWTNSQNGDTPALTLRLTAKPIFQMLRAIVQIVAEDFCCFDNAAFLLDVMPTSANPSPIQLGKPPHPDR